VPFWSVGLIFIHWYTLNTVDSKHVHFAKKRPYTNGKMLPFLGSIPLSLSPVVIQRLRLMSWSHLISPSLIIPWALDHGTPMGSEGKGGPEGFIDLPMVSHRTTHDVCCRWCLKRSYCLGETENMGCLKSTDRISQDEWCRFQSNRFVYNRSD